MAEPKFTADDLLSFFCATKPLKKMENREAPPLPCPPSARYAIKKREEALMRDSVEPEKGMSVRGGIKYTKRYDHPSSLQPPLSVYGFNNDYETSAGRVTKPQANLDDDCVYPTTTTVFDGYSFDHDDNPNLPIAAYRKEILATVESNSVTVIQGSTGSGKSTQVPQFLLSQHASQRRYCNIICTQPRRIAAMSVAKFVAESRGWRLGTLVGYQIAMDKVVSEDTRLTFVTTGVLLQKLVNMKNMNQFTHIILDEVHERDQDTDFCLLVVRKLLWSNSRHVKVILMSATMESEVFADYYSVKVAGHSLPAPIVMVEGRTYTVTEFYLDDLKYLGSYEQPDPVSPKLSDDVMTIACCIIEKLDEWEKDDFNEGPEMRGTILVFLPGLPEIKKMDERLSFRLVSELRLTVLPLHSSISREEQYKVFLKPEKGKRKVILATNIAESSITVPDIKCVIDFCLVKELVCENDTNYQCLKLNWASKASLVQRRGRAGRVSSGRCFRLITKSFFSNHMQDFSTPEMQRCPLESIILHVKQLDLGEPCEILSLALQPPNLGDIERTIISLKEVGAITVMKHGLVNPYDGDLTFVGCVMSSLPVGVKIAKLFVLGHVFGCLEESLVIGAALSLKSFFTKLYKEELKSYKSKMSWSRRSFSDCIAILNAYKEWFRKKSSGHFRSGGSAEKTWCLRNLINKNVINEVAELVQEISARLADFNIRAMKPLLSRDSEIDPQNTLLLKLVISGAFYPNYFSWGTIDEVQAQKEMSGHDPTSTVMLGGLPPNPERFSTALAQMFNDCGKGQRLHFEQSKVFLEFERQRLSRFRRGGSYQPVLDAVYIALKKRHSRQPLVLYAGREKDMSSSAPAAVDKVLAPDRIPPPVLPQPGQLRQVTVTSVIDPEHLSVQLLEEENQITLLSLMDCIASSRLSPLHLASDHAVGQNCLAKYREDNNYYRAQIEAVNWERREVEVVYVDYGNEDRIHMDYICALPQELLDIPAQAFDCALSGVRPSFVHSSEGYWTGKTNTRLQEMILDKSLTMRVYSIVGSVVRAELWDTSLPHEEVFINQLLIEEGHAVPHEETLPSRLSHEEAEKSCSLKSTKLWHQSSHSLTLAWDVTSSPLTRAWTTGCKHILKGPSNPHEVSFYAMSHAGGLRTTRVERDSVNSVVVNSEPQDGAQRMMVASHVALNPSGDTILARDTTLLPNIHGLPQLVCLLFAPFVEMRTDRFRRQYTGALCGLGYSETLSSVGGTRSLYPDHDMEIVFDTTITQQDMDQINGIRRAINLALSSENQIVEWEETAIKRIQQKARHLILDLVLQVRDPVSPTHFANNLWNQLNPDDIIYPEHTMDLELYPLHNLIGITGEKVDQGQPTEKLVLRQQLAELRKLASRSDDPQTLFCVLCHVNLASPHELLCHLQDRSHVTQEKLLFSVNDTED